MKRFVRLMIESKGLILLFAPALILIEIGRRLNRGLN